MPWPVRPEFGFLSLFCSSFFSLLSAPLADGGPLPPTYWWPEGLNWFCFIIIVWWLLFFDYSLLVKSSWFVGFTIGLSPRFVFDFTVKFVDPGLPPSFGGTWLVMPCAMIMPFYLSCTGRAEPPLFCIPVTWWLAASLPGVLSLAYFTLSFENFWLKPAFLVCADVFVMPEQLTA